MRSVLPRDIEAQIVFLPTEHGGRKSAAITGYRGQFYYDGADWDAPHEYPDVPQVDPGEKVRAYLSFVSPAKHWGRIYVGMPFLVREGNRAIGFGAVTEIVDLESSARREKDGAARDA